MANKVNPKTIDLESGFMVSGENDGKYLAEDAV
jgi:hypothetical protein